MNIDTDLIYNDKESEKRRLERKKRREERRKKSSSRRKVLSFLWGAREFSPIISSSIDANGLVDYEAIARKAKKQEALFDEVINLIEGVHSANEKSLLKAGMATSYMVSQEGDASAKSIAECISILSQANDHKSDIIEQIELGMFSSDALVNIKLQLLPSLHSFQSSLDTLCRDQHVVNEYTAWLSNISTELAKDVAFNWDKKSSYRDRETLFVSMLPTCARIATGAFFEYLSQYNGASRAISHSLPFDAKYPMLHKSLNELDMGYMSHPEINMDWLFNQLGSILNDHTPHIQIPKEHGMYYNKIKGSIVSDIDSIASSCWKKESNRYIDKIQEEINGLPESEIEPLMESKYSKPMPIGIFVSSFIESLSNWPGVINPIEIDLTEVATMAEKKMAALWGLTEAMCQIRRSG